jgi:hypothetical protein
MEWILHQAVAQHRLVEITLDNRKSYIGLPLESKSVSTPNTDVSVIPLYSGFRDKKTLKLTLTQNYGPVVMTHTYPNNPYSDWIADDFSVVFPMSKIVSVRFFNEEAFDDFQIGQSSGYSPRRNRRGRSRARNR